MKKKIFGALVVVAIAVGAMINVNLTKVSGKSGNLNLANVEALAQGEGGYSCSVTTNCMSGSVSCTGVVSCERSPSWVKCDGKKTYC